MRLPQTLVAVIVLSVLGLVGPSLLPVAATADAPILLSAEPPDGDALPLVLDGALPVDAPLVSPAGVVAGAGLCTTPPTGPTAFLRPARPPPEARADAS
jgi:hypothetical protein